MMKSEPLLLEMITYLSLQVWNILIRVLGSTREGLLHKTDGSRHVGEICFSFPVKLAIKVTFALMTKRNG